VADEHLNASIRTRNALLRLLYAVALGSAALAFGGPTHPGAPIVDGDYYAAMARHYGSVSLEPFSYRVLVPTIAGFFPGGPRLGFVVIGVGSIVLAGWAVGRILDRHGLPASAGEIVVLVSLVPVLFVRQPVSTDAFALGMIALGLLLIDRGAWIGVATVMTVGVLGRETVLLLAVSVFLVARRRYGSSMSYKLTAAVSVVPFVTFWAIRMTTVLYGRHLPPRLQPPSEIMSWWAAHDGGILAAALGAAAFSLGPLWGPAVRALRHHHPSDLTVLAWPVALLPLPTLLFVSDWSRVEAVGVVGAVLLAAMVTSKRGLHVAAVGVAACSLLGMSWSGGFAAPVLAAGVAIATAGVIHRIPNRGPRSGAVQEAVTV
jgi:hypothetical protein